MPCGVAIHALLVLPDVVPDTLVSEVFIALVMPVAVGAAEGLKVANRCVALLAGEELVDQDARIGMIELGWLPGFIEVAPLAVDRE